MTFRSLQVHLKKRNPEMGGAVVKMRHDEFWRFAKFMFDKGAGEGDKKHQGEADMPSFMKGLFK